MRDYTARPSAPVLGSLLSSIHSFPDSLIVFNHPLSDQGRIGFEINEPLVHEFLEEHGKYIHALETNALQPHKMNLRVSRIAEKFDLPIVAGGDRHGLEPSGAINLTNAQTFSEFVREVRYEKTSNVLLMPQYNRPLKLRYAENIRVVLGNYKVLADRASWHDRVFYRCPDGITRSLSEMAGKRTTAFSTMRFALAALGLANQLARPISDFQD